MNDDNDPFDGIDPDDLPPNFSVLSVSADEVEYLQRYWELKDPAAMFGWAVRLLYDLSKADEAGWCLLLQKAELDTETKTLTPDPDYKSAAFKLEWLMPQDGTYCRLPLSRLEDLRRKKGEGSAGKGEGI